MPTTATVATRTDASRMDDPNWWRQASVYQIYPRSFADSNGDGIGDLNGITAKVPYLETLGIDAVWLSPFYPSALADGGYDVDDYRNVDPRLGSLEDFDRMAHALHAAGIKLIVDIVPNHSSDRHEWFREALAAPKGSAARDRYIFRDGLGENGDLPPSDWESVFGGPAWERITEPDGTPGQWYMHIFAREQPDFNWDNPEVRDDFLKTLRFWSDRGVDGFRIDVAHALTKNLEDTLPSTADLEAQGEALYLEGRHPYWDRDDVHDIYAQWRKVFNEYNPPRTAVAEAWVHADRRARYASPEGLGQAFNFDLLQADFDAAQFRGTITKNLAEADASGASSTWVFSNHDVVRHATRYGLPAAADSAGGIMAGQAGKQWLLTGGRQQDVDVELGLRRARAASLLMFALPGSAYLYQGEELGLQEVGCEIADSERQDPSFFRNKGVEIGRDGCRVPLPWTTAGSSFGFGAGGSHLPQPEWFAGSSVEAQEAKEGSTLALYRTALALRGELQAAETLEWLDTGRDDVLAFRRPNGWTCITNFGTEPAGLPDGEVLVSSSPLEAGTLPGSATAWLR
ncbi:glycoside hydrolase family 13 protein [Pseudarthrobacter sp. C4D7]|uniref:glycoside hydrolase family 13 protein n=1 Tax=Pseudarthrobacter sp. C4D7 TaxID=2735268 RepID=UPI0015859957|nr:glycoside hydrolase family 13 protein [Pseudarthrobacter sp. C4D7]NUT70325.1 glycoside hydrolase family 13 protein [Pseudarthrobacter sp. C4D7]